MKTLRLLAAAFIVSSAVAGTISPEVADKSHVEYGKKFPFVARLLCANEDGQKDGSCVLIGDRWAITAAHVVEDMDEWVIVTDDGKRHVVEGVAVHEDFRRGAFRDGGDIAVCKSRDSFGLDWYPALYDGKDEAGKVVSIAGYGATGTFTDGRNPFSDGLRRAGSNVIDEATEGQIFCSVGNGRKTSLEFLIAPGDSGGGLFIGNRLAGVNSHVSVSGTLPPQGVLGEESSHTRVSDYLDWIRKEARCE